MKDIITLHSYSEGNAKEYLTINIIEGTNEKNQRERRVILKRKPKDGEEVSKEMSLAELIDPLLA